MHAGRTPALQSKGCATQRVSCRVACPDVHGGTSYTRHEGDCPVTDARHSFARCTHQHIEASMADSSRSLVRAFVVVTIFIGATACSNDSTSATSRSIVGHVTINSGDARIPAENFVGAHNRATLTPLASNRGRAPERINVLFRGEALGMGRLGAMSVRTTGRAREVAATIRARLASHPASSSFTVTDVSP